MGYFDLYLYQIQYIRLCQSQSLFGKRNLDNLLEKFICSANLPFRVVEKKYFMEFTKALRPSYSLPSAKIVSTTLLESLYKNEQQNFLLTVEGKKATILQDCWTTNQHECVLGHSLYVDQKTHFINATSMEEIKKTADNCLQVLLKTIEESQTLCNIGCRCF